MHEVLVNRSGGLSLPRKSVVRLTDRPDMTLDVYRGRKTTIQQQQSEARDMVPYLLPLSSQKDNYEAYMTLYTLGLQYVYCNQSCSFS